MELDNRDKMGIEQAQDVAFRGFKKFSCGGWVGGLQVIIVSVLVLYVSFTPIYIRQVRLLGTPVYVELR